MNKVYLSLSLFVSLSLACDLSLSLSFLSLTFHISLLLSLSLSLSQVISLPNNAACSVLYECVKTVCAIFPCTPLLQEAVGAVSAMLEHKQMDYRYLGRGVMLHFERA